MLKPLNTSWTYFRKNFLNLIISFCVTAIPLQLIATFSPKSVAWQLFLSFLFLVGFLSSASFDVLIVRSLHYGDPIELSNIINSIKARLLSLLGLGCVIFFSLVLTLFLLSRFLNFVFSLAVLFLPVFMVFSIPELVIAKSGTLKSLRNSIVLSWDNLSKTAILTLVPGVLIIYLWFNGFWIVVWCFLLPFMVVAFSKLYLDLTSEQLDQKGGL
jgi:hypothetical protein